MALLLASPALRAVPRVLIRATNIIDAAAGTNSNVLYMVAADGLVSEVTTDEGRTLRSWPMQASPTAFDVSLDGRYVVLGYPITNGATLPLHIIDTQTGELRIAGTSSLPDETGIAGLRFSSNGKVLILAETALTNQTRLRTYDPAGDRFHTFTNEITRSNFVESEDRSRIATVTRQLGWYSANSDTYETSLLSPTLGLNAASLTVRTDGGFLVFGTASGAFSETFTRTASFPSLRASLPYGVAKIPGTDHLVSVANGVSIMEMNTRSVRLIPANAADSVPGRLRLLRLIDSGRRAVVLTREVVEIVSLDPEPFRLVSAHKLHSTNQIVLRFSAPFATTNVQSSQSYVVTGGSATRAAPHPQYPEMVVVTVTGSPTAIRVRNIISAFGLSLEGPSEVVVQQGPILPDDDGLEVEGYQESFDAPLGPQWSFVSGNETLSDPDNFRAENGTLQVGGRRGASRHMILKGDYDRENQEVLMRVWLHTFGSRSAGPACGVGLRPGGSGTNEYYGASFHSLMVVSNTYFLSSLALGSMPLEISGRPGFSDRTGQALLPPTDNWHWVRLRHSAGGDSNRFQMQAKWWPADGTVPEPTRWLEGRYSSEMATTNPIAGLAGLIAPDYLGNYKVDYMLIRAAGLPRIRVRPDGPRAPEWILPPSDGWGSRVTLAGRASGEAPLSYRWYLGSQQVASNATGLITTGPSAEPFRLVASNAYGSITSAPVHIRAGSSRVYFADFPAPATQWSNASNVTYQNVRYIKPRDSGRMSLSFQHAPFEGRLLVFANLSLPDGGFVDLKVSDPAGARLFRTQISATTTRGSSRYLSFQSFPAQYGEALVPPFTLSYLWGGFDASLRPTPFPDAFVNPFNVEFEVPGSVTNLVFDGYNDNWAFSSLYAMAKPVEAPMIKFERALFQTDDVSNELPVVVVRDGGLDATFSVNVLVKPLPNRFSTGNPVSDFARQTNTLVFGPGVLRLTNWISLPPAPRSNDVRLSLALTNPVGFELMGGYYALGLAASHLEPVSLELPEGDILSEGRRAIPVRVPSTNALSVPRAITVRLEPIDGADGVFETVIDLRHGGLSPQENADGTARFFVYDDLERRPDRRWRVRLTEPSYGLKPTGNPITVTVLDDDSEGFETWGFANPTVLTKTPDGGFLAAQPFGRAPADYTGAGPIVRVGRDGRVDPNFQTAYSSIYDEGFVPLSDGGWLVRQSFQRPYVSRIRADGSLHPEFRVTNPNSIAFWYTEADLGDDSGLFAVYAAGNPSYSAELWRIDAAGVVDEALRTAVGIISIADGDYQIPVGNMVRLRDGRVVISGPFVRIGTNAISKLAVVSPAERTVAAFGEWLARDTNQFLVFGATTNGGTMVMLRYPGLDRIVRLRGDGSEDAAFQAEPLPYGGSRPPVLLPDGGVIVPGMYTNMVRLTPEGRRDTSFHGPDLHGGYLYSILAKDDGTLVIGGNFQTVNGVSRNGIALLSRTGELLPWPAEPEWPAAPTGVSPVTQLGGTPAILAATASGGAAARYQWQRNGQSVPGATNLTLTAIEPGSYRLAVIGSGIIRTSPEVAVRFVDPAARPRLSINPAGQGAGWRASILTPAGFSHRIEVSDDLQTWTPAEAADFDGTEIRLGRAEHSRRYYRVVVE